MNDEAGAAAESRWRRDETARLRQNVDAKPVPSCPICTRQMSITSTKNRGEQKPVRVFQCMNFECSNKRRYNRQGVEIW